MAQARNYVFTVNHALMADGVNHIDRLALLDFEGQKHVSLLFISLKLVRTE